MPFIYDKLPEVDLVDLLPASGTNISSAAMPSVIIHNRLVMVMLALVVNETFH